MNRRNFLKLGSLFVPVVAAPTVAYSFCGGWQNSEAGTITFAEGSVRIRQGDAEIEISSANGIVLRGRLVRGSVVFEDTEEQMRIASGVITLTAKHPGQRTGVIRRVRL